MRAFTRVRHAVDISSRRPQGAAFRPGCSWYGKSQGVPSSAQVVVALRLAATLSQQATLIRARTQTLAAAGQSMRWRSAATVAFGHQLEGVRASLQACANQFEVAAYTINRIAVVG